MASRAALAAEKQGAYVAFHRELMSLNGPITPEAIEGTGKKLGLDVAKLKADMSSKEVEGALMQNQRLANAIGVQSTPSFVIGGELISGAMDLTRFEELISKSSNRICSGSFIWPRLQAPASRAATRKPRAFRPRGGLVGVVDSLLFAQHAIEMFRRSLPNGAPKHRLDQLANRLTKILAETRKLNPDG